jgi:hypothetical protein
MNILILVLSVDDQNFYTNLYKKQKDTWDSEIVDGVKTMYYFGNAEDNFINKENIYINTKEELMLCGYKTLKAFELIKNLEFDYIFRTNSSSYIDKKLLLEFIKDKPKENFYSGVVGDYHGLPFASGSGYFLSKDLLNYILENKNQWNHQVIDDVSVGIMMLQKNIKIFPGKRFDLTDEFYENLFNIDPYYYHYRCKMQSNRLIDIENMEKIHIIKKSQSQKMNKINQKYIQQIQIPSDINEHIETLYKYALQSNHITEMGVRFVSSTWAFLNANSKKIISYDISYHNKNLIDEVVNIAKEYNINYSFILADVLDLEIEQTDLLFIDTLHTYNQLSNELKKHHSKVNKFIILHDTESFSQVDELIYDHASNIIKNTNTSKTGLMNAINDFLKSENGKNWKIKEIFKNNNGLCILERGI